MTVRIGVYTLRIMRTIGDSNVTDDAEKWDDENQEVIDNIAPILTEAEMLVSNALPDGYYCKITDAQ
ncbi:MAG TPA: hypothetical protein VH593_20000 [Ktedonobacteraceae bacterium]